MTDTKPADRKPVGVAVVGAGYWGPNLVRNFSAHDACDLRWVCDLDIERARLAVGRYSTLRLTTSLEEVLDDPQVEAVAVATPAGTHVSVAGACFDAGKHVLVEKPLAPTVVEGRELVDRAAAAGVVLMCDHTYCYTPAVARIRELVAGGQLGDIQYVDSVRINLGLIQPDVDVFWDLAPHDLSILDFILPADRRPHAVAAQGADPIGSGKACVGYLALPLDGNAIAHTHVNWLSPTKIRTMIVGGSSRMVVWDDLHPTQRLSMFDKGVDLRADSASTEARHEALIAYRVGDLVAPALPEFEALRAVVGEFAGAIREHRVPLTDGAAGLRVLEILEAASQSLADDGAAVPLEGGR
ncbi:MAG TPA: Gfo/Idh/MocA family oxidoreductase [Acidimicrobiia bacterium]|nr:Gfo/Idh/MocA family oxidoreductase [Acidimicrobiia bacterium]